MAPRQRELSRELSRESSNESCELCRAITKARTGQNPHLIHEFEHSFLVVGAHQLFAGYCVLVAKQHVREPFELPEAALSELMRSARAIQQAFEPWKMNYGCYGNQVPHVHWHLFPRSAADPLLKQVPWMRSSEFDRHLTSPAQARAVIERVKNALR